MAVDDIAVEVVGAAGKKFYAPAAVYKLAIVKQTFILPWLKNVNSIC